MTTNVSNCLLILERDRIKDLMSCVSDSSNAKFLVIGLEIMRKLVTAPLHRAIPLNIQMIEWLFPVVIAEIDDEILNAALLVIIKIFETLSDNYGFMVVCNIIDVTIGILFNKIISLVK